ncbi:MAG: hypothetical protein AAFZ18_22410 [Myxococcota bacterium]
MDFRRSLFESLSRFGAHAIWAALVCVALAVWNIYEGAGLGGLSPLLLLAFLGVVGSLAVIGPLRPG